MINATVENASSDYMQALVYAMSNQIAVPIDVGGFRWALVLRVEERYDYHDVTTFGASTATYLVSRTIDVELTPGF